MNKHHEDCVARGMGQLAIERSRDRTDDTDQRATTAIDIVFPATAAAGQRVKEALMILTDQAAKDIEQPWFEEGENMRVADAFVVDIMLNAPIGLSIPTSTPNVV